MYNFIRKYTLTISNPPVIDNERKNITPEDGSSQVVFKEGDYRTEDLDAVVITDLSFNARISGNKSSGSQSPLSLTLRGFDDQTLTYINKNSVIILKAGFENTQESTLFVGQVVTRGVNYESDIPEVTITASEGYTPSHSVKVSAVFPDNVSYKEILEFLITKYGDNGIPVGRSLDELVSLVGKGKDLPIDQIVFPDGYTLPPTYLDTALSKVCKDVGFTYYFSKSRLYVEPENYVDNEVTSFNLTPSQILSLADKTITANNAKDTQESSNGYKLKVMLDGRVDVGEVVDIDYERVSGQFKITGVTHVLDYEGQDWYTEMEIQNV